jgi:PAS domain S-box-containing protein
MAEARIMVVEDESIVALDIKRNLQSLGYEVSALALSGEEAIRQATETQPDLILMDIRLKGAMDGVEAAEHIRGRFDIPVVFLTSYSDTRTVERAKITGPFGYLLKPFEERELHIAIEMALYKHHMERRLKENEQWLATTLRGIGDAVIATNARGRIKFMNPIAEALTGWHQGEAIEKEVDDVFRIVHAETRAPIKSPLEQVLREGVLVNLDNDVLLIATDGKEIPIDDSIAPITDDQGHITGVVIVFRDSSQRVQADAALRRTALELQARNDDLNAFAHTVAHDLKIPLNPLLGFAEFMQKEYAALTEEQVCEYLGAIARSARQMSNIIEELLLLAQVRTIEVKWLPLDMARIVDEVQQRLAYMIEEHQAEIIVPHAWSSALGYSPWIEEVLVNYVSNAIKYGGRPPRIELGAAVQANAMVRFWVRDNGHGLTPEQQARLFRPFTQLEEVRATGHGLGLSIVRRIVEKLGGEVGVTSEIGRGSVFTFSLPQAEYSGSGLPTSLPPAPTGVRPPPYRRNSSPGEP